MVQHVTRWQHSPWGCCQVIIWKAWLWAIVGNLFEESHAPCRIKTSFVDLERVGTMCPLQQTKFFVPSQWQPKAVTTFLTLFFLYFIYCWPWSCPKYSWNTAHWTLTNNKSIINCYPEVGFFSNVHLPRRRMH